MAKRKVKAQKKNEPVEVKEEELDRFAGSSESEQEPESDNDEGEDEAPEEPTESAAKDDKESVDDDDADQYEHDSDGPSGLASAMSKILGTHVKESAASVILSKTMTPLQRMAKLEKEQAKVAKEKRRLNREKHLEALHIPLSVATTRPLSGASGLQQELETERAHRRVATRGVVALFNAIAQHQKKHDGTAETKSANKSEVKNMTKHGFLDMIKSAASDKTGDRKGASSTKAEAVKPKWNALKDDFMMGSKLKDWDKESSDEEEDEPVEDNFDEEQPKEEVPTKANKRQKV
jgi:Rrp15p